jgi:hypothetical protein
MEYFKTNNTNTDPFIKNNEDTNPARFGHLNAIVDVITALQNTPPGSGIASVQAGTDISVDNTDPLNPIINSTVVYSSGSFTPVVSNESNIVNVVVDGGLYSRVGDIVTMSFRLSFELDAAANNGTFNFSLPIATTFTTRYQLMGIAKFNNSTASDNTNYVVEADNSFVTLGIASISSSAAADTFQDCEMMVQYQII